MRLWFSFWKKFWNDSVEPDWKKERKKLERKQFSKRRIELLLEQKKNEFPKRNADEIETELNESKKWTKFLNDNRLKNILTGIGIFYHQFSGEFKSERIKIESEKTESAEKINVDFFKNIKENELNWIKL